MTLIIILLLQWKENGSGNIIAVSAGKRHTVGLKSDGTVVTAGSLNAYGQCNVSGWKDIIAVSAGENHTVGLKADGTVVAVGDNKYGQCNVSDWKDFSYLLSFRINNLILVSGAKTLKNNYSQKTRILNAYSLSGINNKNNPTI